MIVKFEEKHHAAISKLEDELRVTIRRLEADRPEDDRARRTSRLGEADDPSGKASTNPSSKRDDDSRRLLPQYRNPAPTGRLADIAPGRGGPPTDRADNTSVPVACHARRGGEPVDRVVGGDFGVPVPRRASPGGVPLYRVLGAGDLGVPVARRRGRGGEPFDRSGRTRGSDIPAVIRPPSCPTSVVAPAGRSTAASTRSSGSPGRAECSSRTAASRSTSTPSGSGCRL